MGHRHEKLFVTAKGEDGVWVSGMAETDMNLRTVCNYDEIDDSTSL